MIGNAFNSAIWVITEIQIFTGADINPTQQIVPDSTTDDPRWECVDIKAVRPIANPVTLEMCKADPRLKDMVLVNNTRLSVQPVTAEEWAIVLELAGE